MEKVKFDLTQASKDIKEIISDFQKFHQEEENNKVTKQLKSFYNAFNGKVLTLDERVLLLSKLHTMREFTGWFIGEILLKEEDKINKEIDEWKKGKRVNPPQYQSIYDFIKENEDRIGFGKSSAYNYMGIRKKADLNTFLKLGVRKTLLIMSVKDEELTKKITRQAVQQDWTVERIKERIDLYINKEKKLKSDEIYNFKKIVNDEIIISSVLNDKRIKDNEMLLSFEDKESRDTFNDVFLEVLPEIKEKIYKQQNI